jgi:SAM-dependent methyltransferase
VRAAFPGARGAGRTARLSAPVDPRYIRRPNPQEFPMKCSSLLRRLAACALVAFAPALPASEPAPRTTEPPPLNAGPYVPSPESVVAEMLKLADIRADDFVIDLGSGDGRIVLTAAKVYGASGFGVEIQDDLVKLSNEAARRAGLADRVRFVTQDLFATDVSRATVLTMYLLPDTVNMLSEKLLRELRPGTRILSHDYPLSGWLHEDLKEFDVESKIQISGVTRTALYLYVVPARVSGRWDATLPASVSRQRLSFDLAQQMQKLNGMAQVGAREVPFDEIRLRGEQLSFRLPLDGGRIGRFTGTVRGDTIEGTVDSGGMRAAWSAKLAR